MLIHVLVLILLVLYAQNSLHIHCKYQHVRIIRHSRLHINYERIRYVVLGHLPAMGRHGSALSAAGSSFAAFELPETPISP